MASRLGHVGAWPCTWVRGVQHGLACLLLGLAGSWEGADVKKNPCEAWVMLEVDGDTKAATDQAGKCKWAGHRLLVRMMAP